MTEILGILPIILFAFLLIRQAYRSLHRPKKQFVWQKQEKLQHRWSRRKKCFLSGLVLLLLAGTACLLWPEEIAVPEPMDESYVQDFAGILSDETKQDLQHQSLTLEKQRGYKLMVITIPSIKNHNIDDYTETLIHKWQLGDKHVDHGVLMLIAVKERKIRLDTTEEFSETLPEEKLNHILDAFILPEFKQEQMNNGISQGYHALYHSLDKDIPTPEPRTPMQKIIDFYEHIPRWICAVLFFMFCGWFSRNNDNDSNGSGYDDNSFGSGSGSSGDGGGDSSGGDGGW